MTNLSIYSADLYTLDDLIASVIRKAMPFSIIEQAAADSNSLVDLWSMAVDNNIITLAELTELAKVNNICFITQPLSKINKCQN